MIPKYNKSFYKLTDYKKRKRKEIENLSFTLLHQPANTFAFDSITFFHNNEKLRKQFENYIFFCEKYALKKPNSLDEIVKYEIFKLRLVNQMMISVK